MASYYMHTEDREWTRREDLAVLPMRGDVVHVGDIKAVVIRREFRGGLRPTIIVSVESEADERVREVS